MDDKHYKKYIQIGLNILHYRKEQGLTQLQLAEMTGYSRNQMLCSMSDFQYSSSLISTVLSRLFLIDFLHICAKAALITIPADKAMPGIGTAFTLLEQRTNGTFLPHGRIFQCRQGLTPASVIYMLQCDFLPECKKAPESS